LSNKNVFSNFNASAIKLNIETLRKQFAVTADRSVTRKVCGKEGESC